MQIKPRKIFLYLFISLIINCCILQSIGNASERYPKKIISLGPVITDMIYLLNAQEKLIGVTNYCTIPTTSEPKEIIGSVMLMNVEKIIALAPDLVIANDLTRQEQIKALKRLGVSVFKFSTPKNFSEICQHLLDLGELIGGQKKAGEIVKKAEDDVKRITLNAKNTQKRKVFIQIGLKPIKTAIKDTFINEYIEFSGGENIALNAKDNVFSREQVLVKNPDVIFIATMGSSKKAGESEKQSWMKFKFLNACKNNEIHVLDPDIVCSPTPPVFAQGLKDFYRYIHPKSNKSGDQI
ncbi:MAG: ABC transporter substrate-binding protein [Desulfobacteraceae bacterium]|nr:ABC transporter substrate-binding protein [Desulfobacteraceae bacterium]